MILIRQGRALRADAGRGDALPGGLLRHRRARPSSAVVQIIVYTGAVMMLFLFVLMLVGVTSADSLVETIKGQRGWPPVCAASASACC